MYCGSRLASHGKNSAGKIIAYSQCTPSLVSMTFTQYDSDQPSSKEANSRAKVTLLPLKPRHNQPIAKGLIMGPIERVTPLLASRLPVAKLFSVTLPEKQKQLVEDFLIIPDAQERLTAIVDQARQSPPLDTAERTESNRVQGCISLAWVTGEIRDGRCFFRSDADSPLVRGLLKLLCDFYSDAPPDEVATTEPTLLEDLGLARNLSPTRLNGLRSVRAKICDFAISEAANL